MKKQFTELIGVCCTLVLLLIGTSSAQAQYCIPPDSDVSVEWLAGVEFAGIDNESGNSTSYTDYTDQVGMVVPGQSYTFVATIGNPDGWEETVTVFIDFNQDEVFDNVTERFNIGTFCASHNCQLTADILIPVDAIPGLTRMRVIHNYFEPIADACSGGSFSETEDYGILVSGDCSPPIFSYTEVDNCEAYTYDVSATLNDFGGNPFVTVYMTRSDGVPVDFVTLPDFLVGQTVSLIANVPFGVIVTASIEGTDPACNLSPTWTEEGLCPPSNDSCADAIVAECGETYEGSTVNASAIEGQEFCAGTTPPTASNGGVWYTFELDATYVIDLDLSGSFYDTKMWLYSGSCEGLTCIVGNDDGGTDVDSRIQGTYPEGVYYVYITGFTTARGDYIFNYSCTELNCVAPTVTAVAVDDADAEIEGCLNVGETHRILVSLDGGDGNDTYTVTVGDSTVTMVSPGTHIFGDYPVGSAVNVTIGGDQDPLCDQTITVPAIPVCPPSNDSCADAQVITCGETVSGTNIGAGQDASCNGGQLREGVWYSLTLDYPAVVSLETCHPGTNFDTDISVKTGPNCESLTCFNGFNGSGHIDGVSSCTYAGWAAGGPNATFNGEAGVTYYIMVHGFGTGTFYQGTFELSVSCVEIECITPTMTAIAVHEDDSPVVDCMEIGEQFFVNVELNGGSGNDSGYNLTANGSSITLSSPGEHQFGPFNAGTIVNVSAVGLDDDNCEVFATATGTICPPPNDECASAQELICGSTIAGSTIGASDAPGIDFNSCGGNMPGPSYTAWYTFTTENVNEITLTESNATGLNGSFYDLEFFVYTGECGGPYTCVAGQNFGNVINFTSEEETTYYVLVSGFAGSVGTFNLSLSCEDVTCSPTATAVPVDSEGNEIVDCVDIQNDYYVLVSLSGGDNNDFYNTSVNGLEPVQIPADGSAIIGPIPASQVANVTVAGVDQVSCSATTSTFVDVCPPSNDMPCGAIALQNDGTTSTYSNIDATADSGEITPTDFNCVTSWCELTADATVWFTFEGPASGRAEVSLCGPTSISTFFDSQVAIYSVSDCSDYSTFELVGANDDAGILNCSSQFTSIATVCVVPGETYYVQVDGYFGSTSPFDITVSEVDGAACSCVLPDFGPEGFTYASTTPVCDEEPGYTLTLHSLENTGSSDGFNYRYSYVVGDTIDVFVPAGGPDYTSTEVIPLGTLVWVSFDISDENCDDVNSNFPYTALIAQPTFACDPDCEGTPGGDVGPGSPCTIDGAPGSYNQDCMCVAAPENDTCNSAIELSCDDYVVGSNISASSYLGCNGSERQTVWYTYTSAVSATVTLSTCNPETDFDTDINMYTGSCDGDDLSCFSGWGGIGYIDGISGCTFQSWASEGTFEAEPGVTYYIGVTGFYATNDPFSSWEGNFGLSVSCVVSSSATLNGTVEWTDTCDDRDVLVSLYTPDTDVLVGTYNGVVNAAGEFTISELPLGTYDVIAKVNGTLAVGFADFDIAAGENDLNLGSVQRGDLNGDNGINIIDFSLINASFNSVIGDANYNPLADLNCSGGVNILDVSILSPGFLQTGASAPLD